MNSYYPIGTVVTLKQNPKFQFMIAGYLPKKAGSKVFDYFAVPYPTGMINSKQYIGFNRESVAEVVFEGFVDAECQKVLQGFDEFANNLREKFNEK